MSNESFDWKAWAARELERLREGGAICAVVDVEPGTEAERLSSCIMELLAVRKLWAEQLKRDREAC